MREETIGKQRIICADSRDVLPGLTGIDVTLTDPPYGIEGGSGGDSRLYRKGKYEMENWEDSRAYIEQTIVPIIVDCRILSTRVVLTSGNRCMYLYPEPDDIGCFYCPATVTHGPWGFSNFTPILYYGRDFRAGIGAWPTSKQVTESAPKNGHPCPKPIRAWSWLLEKAARTSDTVLDPFLGSGTTLVCCELTGRSGVGIEIEPKFYEIALREVEKATKQQRMDFQPEKPTDVSLLEIT
jgi:DNA modification methylase